MVIFTDKENYPFINSLRDKANTHIIITSIENFEVVKYMDYWNYCHTIDIEKDSHSPELYMMWNEKTFMIEKAIDLNIFKSDYFFWMDIGCVRDKNMLNIIRKFSSTGLPKDKVILSIVTNSVINTQLNNDKISVTLENKNGRSCNVFNYIQGGFFGGYKDAMRNWVNLYRNELSIFVETKTFGGKDQYIMSNISIKFPQHVYCLKPIKFQLFNTWFSFLVRMSNRVNENVLLLGIIKNGENVIDKNIDYLIKTSDLFTKSKILIYENNSTDNTKNILSKYKNNISIFTDNFSDEYIKNNSKMWAYTKYTGSDHPVRIEWITYARNKLVHEIRKSEYDEYKYVIWFDVDSNGWDINGIYDSFQHEGWDAIFANGINNNNEYYDYYALRMKNFEFGPEILGELWWNKVWNKEFVFKADNELVPIYSAFAGIGIYKKEIFDNIEYTCMITEDIYNFYKKLLQKCDNNIRDVATKSCYKFGDGVYMFDNSIQLKKNSGCNYPMVCEHVGLHFTMINKGYSKLFINPKMVYNR